MSTKVVVVGQNPAILKINRKSRSIQVLNTWLDFLDLVSVSFCNVYEYPGKFTVEAIDQPHVRTMLEGYEKIITLGTVPDRVLKNMGIDHFALPHPSGLNRRLNDKEFVRQELERCREYLK